MEYFEDQGLELYNLREDIGETNNLAGKMPDKVQELRAMMVAWRKETGAVMPTPNTVKPSKQPKAKKAVK